MNISAFRRGTAVVLKLEMPEDHYACAPFLRLTPHPNSSTRLFELCFHRGQPPENIQSGRMVQFEHIEADVPAHVHTLRVRINAKEELVIEKGRKMRRV